MKNKLWLVPIPIIALFTMFQITFDWGEQGKLHSNFLRTEIYPFAKNVNGVMTNLKFKLRGPQKPNQDIVIIVADDESVKKLGRWPWHREYYARLIYYSFKFGVKYLGLDVVYSEPEAALTPDQQDVMAKENPKLFKKIISMGGDPKMSSVMHEYRDSIVLGYAPGICQPRYDKPDECPIDNEGNNKQIDDAIGKFAQDQKTNFTLDERKQSPMPNIITGVFNIPLFRNAASHAGYFSADPDPDGYIRNYSLFNLHDNKIYPSLATKLAELVRRDKFVLDFSEKTRIGKIYFSKTPESPVPITNLGYIGLNFKGPREVFPYLSAVDIMMAAEGDDEELRERVTKALQGKIAFFGVTAIGIYDMRAFPFDSNTPGVEGHATALNNLLDGDSLKSATGINKPWLPLVLIISIGLIFSVLFAHLEAVPGLLVFAGFVVGFGYLDIHYLFGKNVNLPTAFLYLQNSLIFALTLSIRYVLEERNKKFIKSAFSHYLAPQVVDLVLKDPTKLTVGGERKEIAIIFTDLKGFTTISEKMDPKTLSQFLNEYLTAMTDIVFENEGTLDKYIGDAVMAFWGAPLHSDDHVLKACTAGLKMQKKILAIAPDFKARYGIEVGMGIGINAGVVSVGNMGSSKIFEYTVIGDHVNLASRLEGLTRLYGVDILSTKSTMDLLGEKYSGKIFHRVLDSVKVKGKKTATDIVEISFEPFNEEAVGEFTKGKEKFVQQKWDEAIASFKKSSEIFESHHGKKDPVSEVFIGRCEQYKTYPPAPDWDGSIEMRTK